VGRGRCQFVFSLLGWSTCHQLRARRLEELYRGVLQRVYFFNFRTYGYPRNLFGGQPHAPAHSPLEALEPRMLLNGDPIGHVLQVSGRIESGGAVAVLPFEVDADSFDLSDGRIELAFRASATSGDLDPDAVLIRDVSDSALTTVLRQADVDADGDSLVVADLNAGTYTVEVSSQNGATGDFVVDVEPTSQVDGGDINISPQNTVQWIASGRGSWHDEDNWAGGILPGVDDDVVIDVADDVVITFSAGTTQINSLTTSNKITLTGGVLDIATTAQLSDTLTLSGGTLRNAEVSGASVAATSSGGTLDDVTLNTDLALDGLSEFVTVVNGLELNGTVFLNADRSRVDVTGSQTISGTGQFVFANAPRHAVRVTTNNTTVTLGSGITVRGGSSDGNGANLGYSTWFGGASTFTLINEGTILADNGQTLRVNRGSLENRQSS